MFSRTTFIPAVMSRSIVGPSDDAGPSVATILVRRLFSISTVMLSISDSHQFCQAPRSGTLRTTMPMPHHDPSPPSAGPPRVGGSQDDLQNSNSSSHGSQRLRRASCPGACGSSDDPLQAGTPGEEEVGHPPGDHELPRRITPLIANERVTGAGEPRVVNRVVHPVTEHSLILCTEIGADEQPDQALLLGPFVGHAAADDSTPMMYTAHEVVLWVRPGDVRAEHADGIHTVVERRCAGPSHTVRKKLVTVERHAAQELRRQLAVVLHPPPEEIDVLSHHTQSGEAAIHTQSVFRALRRPWHSPTPQAVPELRLVTKNELSQGDLLAWERTSVRGAFHAGNSWVTHTVAKSEWLSTA